MAAPSVNFYIIYLLSSFLIFGAHGVIIQLYEHQNFTGLVWESNSSAGCHNILRNEDNSLSSIRTDTCFIVYWNAHCKSILTEKYLPGDKILSEDQLGRISPIDSFQTCTEEEGGDQLNVDITENYFISIMLRVVFQSYRNVCSCVNVPQYVPNISKWSIDNHHNELLAYYEPNCSVNKWNPKLIAAGHNHDSRDMHELKKTDPLTNITYSIQSFGPNPNSAYFQTSCNSSLVTTERTTSVSHQMSLTLASPNTLFVVCILNLINISNVYSTF